MLLFHVIAIKINKLAISVHKRINTLLEERFIFLCFCPWHASILLHTYCGSHLSCSITYPFA